MIKSFEFYFDFGSPYTFLAHKQIRKIEKQNSIKIQYMPILLGGLLKLAGIKANTDIPVKAKYIIITTVEYFICKININLYIYLF